MRAAQAAERILGPYAVGPKIGGGGMAAVYLGRYVSHPGEEVPTERAVVALKVVKDNLIKDPEYVHMFMDEAAILSRLSHPNLIHTVGFGTQGGFWFIAMELLMGRSLMDLFDRCNEVGRHIPFDVAAWIAREVARGLHYAHELKSQDDGHPLNLIHRDVNPTNVFVRYDGSVKLIDFGLAKSRERKTKSAEGIIKGKFPYLSPEQVTDNVIDRRTDVYALGTSLWELTTGKRLFKRESDIATVRAIQSGEVPDPRKLVDGYPTPLWKVVERALCKNKEGRYPSAGALADDLDSFLGSRSDIELRARLAKLVADLFPGEEAKQRAWLEEATGEESGERATFVPPVPIAEVPERDSSVTLDPPAVASAPEGEEEEDDEDDEDDEEGDDEEGDDEEDEDEDDEEGEAAETEKREGTEEPTGRAAEREDDAGDDQIGDELPHEGHPRSALAEFVRFIAVGAVVGVLVVGAWLALR